MIKIFKTFGGYTEITEPAFNCWINVIKPTEEEITDLSSRYDVPTDVFYDILDSDERPRVEFEDEHTLVIIRIPVEQKNNSVPFMTVPLGIIITRNTHLQFAWKKMKFYLQVFHQTERTICKH
jgi:magnesium transporter